MKNCLKKENNFFFKTVFIIYTLLMFLVNVIINW